MAPPRDRVWATPRSAMSTLSAHRGKAAPAVSEVESTHRRSGVAKQGNSIGMSGSMRPPMSGGEGSGGLGFSTAGRRVSMSPAVANSEKVPYFELPAEDRSSMNKNVQVVIRVRPLNSDEKKRHGYERCLKQESRQTISWIGQPATRFTFDHVAGEAVDQEALFRVVGLPMIENCMAGYNSCTLAYGQTGSGKTHTMLGEISDLEVKPSPDRGMTPRLFEHLFAQIKVEEDSRRDENLKYSCKCSFMEIHNKQITDLLHPSATNLQVREIRKGEVVVENLTEHKVVYVSEIMKLLTQGSANRKMAATNMNPESSRSHSIFTCTIESRCQKDLLTSKLRSARLILVDLAGSERQKSSGANGDQLKEASNINNSLSTLGLVIKALAKQAKGKRRHIPYRNTTLTYLLQDSLGGNSKTTIIASVSPSVSSASETLSTLKFAGRAGLIQNNAVVNEDNSGDVLALQHEEKNEARVVDLENLKQNAELPILKQELKMTLELVEEYEAVATESLQIAEKHKAYAEAKDEEVKKLDEKNKELKNTVCTLKSIVDIVKEEAKRERMQKEELEVELQKVRQPMLAVPPSGKAKRYMEDGTVDRAKSSRHPTDMHNELLCAQVTIRILGEEVSKKEAEIAQCKEHISEKDATAQEYKRKLMELEVKTDNFSSDACPGRQEKINSKSRGSCSRFKCIGTGFVQQMNSEKGEELSAASQRNLELEAIAASRQREALADNQQNLESKESITSQALESKAAEHAKYKTIILNLKAAVKNQKPIINVSTEVPQDKILAAEIVYDSPSGSRKKRNGTSKTPVVNDDATRRLFFEESARRRLRSDDSHEMFIQLHSEPRRRPGETTKTVCVTPISGFYCRK